MTKIQRVKHVLLYCDKKTNSKGRASVLHLFCLLLSAAVWREMYSISAHDLNKSLWRAVWLDDYDTVKFALEKNGRLTCLEQPPFYKRLPSIRYQYENYKVDWMTETKWTAGGVRAYS